MSELFKPMLACSESAHNFFDQLRFPLMASAKLDGIRATVRGGVVYARSNKPFPNPLVQAKFKDYEGVDGEFVLGSPTRHDLCRATGGVTNSHGHPVDDLKLYAFDKVDMMHDSYGLRLAKLSAYIGPTDENVVVHKQKFVETMNELLEFEKFCLECGYEGVILRQEFAPYKRGRSTAKEQYLLKLKRFEDDEAVVIGFEERMHNGNEAVISELGRTSVLHIRRENLDVETWERWSALLMPAWSSVSEVDSMTVSERVSGTTEITISVSMPSTSTSLSELRKLLATPYS